MRRKSSEKLSLVSSPFYFILTWDGIRERSLLQNCFWDI